VLQRQGYIVRSLAQRDRPAGKHEKTFFARLYLVIAGGKIAQPLCSAILAAAIGTSFSSTMTPEQSAESAAESIGALTLHRHTKSTAMRAAERMYYRGTASNGCAPFLT
jgi:hypothetical protein